MRKDDVFPVRHVCQPCVIDVLLVIRQHTMCGFLKIKVITCFADLFFSDPR